MMVCNYFTLTQAAALEKKPKAKSHKQQNGLGCRSRGKGGGNATEKNFEAYLAAGSPMSTIPVTSLRLT